MFGFLFILSFLLVGVQVTVHLYYTTVVEATAFDAARRVADTNNPNEATEQSAEQLARQELGKLSQHTTFDWTSTTPGQVVLTVTTASPEFVPALSSLDSITKTVVVRIENYQ